MNNLTQNQQSAKQAYLDTQQAQMIARYENADQNERSAVIKHIDSFLPVTNGDQKSFWLSFRQKLERLNENNEK